MTAVMMLAITTSNGPPTTSHMWGTRHQETEGLGSGFLRVAGFIEDSRVVGGCATCVFQRGIRKAAFSVTWDASSPVDRISKWIGWDPLGAVSGGTCTRSTADRTSVGNTSISASDAMVMPGNPDTPITRSEERR